MSTIIASNISDGTTSVPSTYVVNGSAKAWVNFNGTGTVPIRGSLNVGSITDNGTGNFTINFTNSLADANYCLTATGSYDITGNTVSNYTQLILKQATGYNTTSSCRISTVYATGTSGGPQDFEYINMAMFR